MEEKRLELILMKMSDIGLIDKKSLSIGTLYIPKMRNYSDDYTNKVQRVFGHSLDNVSLDKIRLDKNRIEYILRSEKGQKHIKVIYLYAYKKKIQEFTKATEQSFIKRNVRPAMLLRGHSLERIKEVMDWLDKNANYKWTLETVGKFIDEDLSKLKSGKATCVIP